MDILAHAQDLIYQLLDRMPSPYQRESLNALLALFLKAQGSPLPEHSTLKSPSALSRFLSVYTWSVRQMIRQVRRAVSDQLRRYRPRGRRPHLQVILDLTTLEKRGKFKAFNQLVRVFDGKRGYIWSCSIWSLGNGASPGASGSTEARTPHRQRNSVFA
jgi:hypothetical protein